MCWVQFQVPVLGCLEALEFRRLADDRHGDHAGLRRGWEGSGRVDATTGDAGVGGAAAAVPWTGRG